MKCIESVGKFNLLVNLLGESKNTLMVTIHQMGSFGMHMLCMCLIFVYAFRTFGECRIAPIARPTPSEGSTE